MHDTTVPTAEERKCSEHGVYLARLLPSLRRGGQPTWSDCGACAEAREAERERKQRESQERERREQWFSDSGVEARFCDATFEAPSGANPAQRAALKRCEAYAQAFSRKSGGLVLIGPTGTGKTHIAGAIVRHVIFERGVRAQMMTARDLVRELRSTWRRGSERSEADVLSDLHCRSLLAIDDLGVGLGTDAEMTQILDVVDGRYRNELPSIATTNATLPELRALVGDRTFDRLLDGAEVIKCDWPTMRRIGRPT